MRQPRQHRSRVNLLAAAAAMFGIVGPSLASDPPPVETTTAHTNCAGVIVNNPGPGTRGANCTAFGDFGTGGQGENVGSAVTSQCEKARARVQGFCHSIPYPDTGSAPNVSWSGYSTGMFGYKARPNSPDADAGSVRLLVHIRSHGFGEGVGSAGATGYVRGWRNGTSNQIFNHDQPSVVTEIVELQPESFGNPGSGEYLMVAVDSFCQCASHVNLQVAVCDSDSIAEVEIDPTDPNAGDYVVLKAPNPSAMTLRFPDANTLEWDPVVEALAYDVVTGDLMTLRGNLGDFSISVDACSGSGWTGTSIPVGLDPLAGAFHFYLARPKSAGGNGSYDPFGDGLMMPRDAGVTDSPGACP